MARTISLPREPLANEDWQFQLTYGFPLVPRAYYMSRAGQKLMAVWKKFWRGCDRSALRCKRSRLRGGPAKRAVGLACARIRNEAAEGSLGMADNDRAYGAFMHSPSSPVLALTLHYRRHYGSVANNTTSRHGRWTRYSEDLWSLR